MTPMEWGLKVEMHNPTGVRLEASPSIGQIDYKATEEMGRTW